MTASCMFPLHQGTLLQHWMVYIHVWPLSSHGCRQMNWNRTQIKADSSLSVMNDSGANSSLYSILSFLVSKPTQQNLFGILGVRFDKNFTFHSHVSAVCSSCVYHIWDLQRICHHLDLDSAKLHATALVSIHPDYCNSLLYGIRDTAHQTSTCSELTCPCCDKVTSFYSQCSTTSFPPLVASKS